MVTIINILLFFIKVGAVLGVIRLAFSFISLSGFNIISSVFFLVVLYYINQYLTSML